MSDDTIDEMFAELDPYYPGSRRRRRAVIESTSNSIRPVEGAWQERSVLKTLHGEERPMYTVGALAQAVNKSEKSVRLWISRGYIPQAPYRMPSVVGSDGITRAGRRLYTKEMIEAAVDAFSNRGLLESRRIEWSLHKDLARELLESWTKIQHSIAQIAN
jgi:hypothetical protein